MMDLELGDRGVMNNQQKQNIIRFENYDTTKVSVEISSSSTLPEVFEAFEQFLRASGYTIPYNKQIDMVDIDE
jgi:hypothetical protein